MSAGSVDCGCLSDAGDEAVCDGPGNAADEPAVRGFTGLVGLADRPSSCDDCLAEPSTELLVAAAGSAGTAARLTDSANFVERCLVVPTRCMVVLPSLGAHSTALRQSWCGLLTYTSESHCVMSKRKEPETGPMLATSSVTFAMRPASAGPPFAFIALPDLRRGFL